MRSRSGTRKSGIRRLATVMAAVGALLASSGIALMAMTTSAAAEECVPRDAYTQTSEWVEESPGEGWVEVDSRVKTDAVEAHWIDLVWHNYNGNLTGTPTVDDANWHAVPGGPPQGQASQHAIPPRVPMVPYSTSGGQGRASWFLYKGTYVPEQGAVYEYLFTFQHDAVTCEVDPPVVEPPVVVPPVVEPPVVEPPAQEPATDVKAPTQTVTPTVVSAGLAGEVAGGTEALALLGAGLLMLAGAGGLVLVEGGERRS